MINNNPMELKRNIAAAHMMLEDLQLYLNTHPTDQVALVQRNAYVNQLKIFKEDYNRYFGMINQDDSLSQYPWQWIDEPWPWECEANYNL